MSKVMIGCVFTQNVLFCFPEPEDIPRNVSKDNRTSTEITLSWKSMAEINGMGNGKVSRNFCALFGLQYKVELANYQVLGTIVRQKLIIFLIVCVETNIYCQKASFRIYSIVLSGFCV